MSETKKKHRYVYKSNALARYGQYFLEGYRYELMKTTALEKNVLTYALSLLDQEGDLSEPVYFDIDDYWECIGIQPAGGRNYTMIMEAVKALRDRSTLVKKIKPDTGEVYYESASWVERYSIENEGRTWVLWFDHNLESELLRLKDNMTKFLPEYIFRLRTAYGKELYEVLCAEEHTHTAVVMPLDELKKRLGVIYNYKLSADFRRYVIDSAVNDINENSLDITVSYKMIKTGRTYTHVEFTTKRLFGECASVGDSPEKKALVQLKEQLDYDGILPRLGNQELLDRAFDILAAFKVKLQSNASALATKFRTTQAFLVQKLDELDGATLLTCLQSSIGDRLAESSTADMLFLSRLLLLETYVTIEEHDTETESVRYQIRYEEIAAGIEKGVIKGWLPHLDVIVRVMREVIYRPGKKYDFYKGTEEQVTVGGGRLRREYLLLQKKHIIYALEQVNATGKAISSPTIYFLPVLRDALYNAWASEASGCYFPSEWEDDYIPEKASSFLDDITVVDAGAEMPEKPDGCEVSCMTMDRATAFVKSRVDYDIMTKFSLSMDPAGLIAFEILVDVVAGVLSTTKSRVRINGQPMITRSVQDVLMQITNRQALAVVERFLAYRESINPDNQRAYLLSAIYQELLKPDETDDLYEDC